MESYEGRGHGMVEIVSVCYISKRHDDCTLCESSFPCWNSNVLNAFEPPILSKPDLEGGLIIEEDESSVSNYTRIREQKGKGKSVEVLQD